MVLNFEDTLWFPHGAMLVGSKSKLFIVLHYAIEGELFNKIQELEQISRPSCDPRRTRACIHCQKRFFGQMLQKICPNKENGKRGSWFTEEDMALKCYIHANCLAGNYIVLPYISGNSLFGLSRFFCSPIFSL